MGTNTITLKSNRFDKTFEVEAYEKNGLMIIRHTSLDQIYWRLPDEQRPRLTVLPFDLNSMPNIPPMFALKVVLESPNARIEQIGEILCMDWERENDVSKSFPLQTCQNRAFDKAFIRFMQFDISSYEVSAVYSSEEISYSNDWQPISYKEITDTGATPEMQNYGYEQKSMNTSNPVTEAYETDNHADNETSSPSDRQDIGKSEAADILPPLPDLDQFEKYPSMSAPSNIPFDLAPVVGAAPEMPSGNTASVPAFPWMTNETVAPLPGMDMPQMQDQRGLEGFGNGLPDTLSEPEFNRPVGNSVNGEVDVYEVSFDVTRGVAILRTNYGDIFYNTAHGTWDGQIDLNQIDLSALYARASKILGQELCNYTGLTEP